MINLIINAAKNDERVRAATTRGSRTNPNAPVDRFQDFDICYYVNDIISFKKDLSWLDIFGDRIMLKVLGNKTILYMMLLTDYKNIWKAIFTMCELFRELALNVAEVNNFIYLKKDDENMTEYLKHIQQL
jgi:hypothetical protein